jgi:hypothetical protein
MRARKQRRVTRTTLHGTTAGAPIYECIGYRKRTLGSTD